MNTNCKMEEETGKNVQESWNHVINVMIYIAMHMQTITKFFHMWFSSNHVLVLYNGGTVKQTGATVSVEQRSERKTS